jgi:hypothetical protein
MLCPMDAAYPMSEDQRNTASHGACASGAFKSKRLNREWKTVRAMVVIYCHGNHGRGGSVCDQCQSLLDYAHVRLQRCVFGGGKPTCVKCPVHCYQPARRSEMKEVMRYSGPRMLWRHPILCVRHWMDGLAQVPEKL